VLLREQANPNFDYAWGIFCKEDDREIVRGIVNEVEQLRELRGCEAAEQQCTHSRECESDAHVCSSTLPPRRYTISVPRRKEGAGPELGVLELITEHAH